MKRGQTLAHQQFKKNKISLILFFHTMILKLAY